MSISEMTREILKETNLSDPHEITDLILQRLDEADYLAALRETVPPAVRIAMGTLRNSVIPVAAPVTPVSPTSPSAPAEFEAPGFGGGGPIRVASRKVAYIAQDAWERKLSAPVNVNGAYKRLRDCTAADLAWVANSLRDSAAASIEKAKYYENLAAAVPENGKLGDLTTDPTEG